MTCSATELNDLFNSPADHARRAIDSIVVDRRRVVRQTRRYIDGPDKASRPHRRRSTRRGHRDDRLEGLASTDATSTETTDAVNRVTCVGIGTGTDMDVPVKTYGGNRCSCRDEQDLSVDGGDNRSRRPVFGLTEDDVDEHVTPSSPETADKSIRSRSRWRYLATVSGTFRMKKSRLRQASVCVRALRHVGDVRRRLVNIKYSELNNVTETKRTTSVISSRRCRHLRTTAIRQDDVIDNVVVSSMMSKFEMTSCVDKYQKSCRVVSSSRINFVSNPYYDNSLSISGPRAFRYRSGSNKASDGQGNDVSSSFTDEQVNSDLTHLIGRLIELEQAFIAAMTLGVQVYSRPLSFHILTSNEHVVLFQNIEKLVVLAEGHVTLLKRLLALTSRREVGYNVLRSYRQHAECTQRAYLDYCNGFIQAVTLCEHLITFNSQFADYVQMCRKLHATTAPNIFQFIQLPVCYQCHVTNWCLDLQTMATPSASSSDSTNEILQLLSTRYDTILNTCSIALSSLATDDRTSASRSSEKQP